MLCILWVTTCKPSYIPLQINEYICYLPAGRSVLRKTVPEVLHKDRGQRPRSVHRPRHNFSQYGPPGLQITFLFHFFLFLLKFLSALLVTNLLLSAGGQDGKLIPPAHETNQITGFFFILPARGPKKKTIIRFKMLYSVHSIDYSLILIQSLL